MHERPDARLQLDNLIPPPLSLVEVFQKVEPGFLARNFLCDCSPLFTCDKMLFCPYCANNLTIGDAEDTSDKAWQV